MKAIKAVTAFVLVMLLNITLMTWIGSTLGISMDAKISECPWWHVPVVAGICLEYIWSVLVGLICLDKYLFRY